jgi:aquaporin Z
MHRVTHPPAGADLHRNLQPSGTPR